MKDKLICLCLERVQFINESSFLSPLSRQPPTDSSSKFTLRLNRSLITFKEEENWRQSLCKYFPKAYELFASWTQPAAVDALQLLGIDSQRDHNAWIKPFWEKFRKQKSYGKWMFLLTRRACNWILRENKYVRIYMWNLYGYIQFDHIKLF